MSEDPQFSEESDAPPADDDDAVESGDLEEEEDDDEEEVEDDDDDDEKTKRRSTGKRSRAVPSRKASKPPKRSRTTARQFMDVEAAVGDDEDEDDEDFEDDAEFLREANEAQLAERELDLSQRRHLNHTFQSLAPTEARGAAGHLASTIGNLERRYQSQHFDGDVPEEVDEDEAAYGDYYESRGDDPTRFLPDIRDAKLWVVATNKGTTERDIVISIMNKALHMQQKGIVFPILSAFAADGIKGRIYVEADNPGQIVEALAGLRSVNTTNIKMVPLKEMGSVYTMGSKNIKPVVRGQLVRLRGGLYAGDLGQVTEYDDQTGYALVRVVPRLDLDEALARLRGKAGTLVSATKEKGKRPLQRLVSREEIEVRDGDVEPGHVRGTFRFDGKLFEETGYILRKVRSRTLVTGEDVAPTVTELKEFSKTIDGGDEGNSWLTLLSGQPLGVRAASYNVGDSVVLQTGDLVGLKGRVTAIDGKTIQVIPEGLKKSIAVSATEVVKYFEVGDSVKVVTGTHAGKSGLITALDLDKGTAMVFWPELSRPFNCSLDSLQQCPSSGIGSGGLSSLAGFSVGDLVQLSGQETAVIFRIDPGRTFSIITTDNKVDTVPLSRLASKRSNDFALAVDADGQQFGVKATVVLRDPVFKGQTGRVQHIWKQHVFVKLSTKDATHGGYRVCRGQDLRVTSADGTAFFPSTSGNFSASGRSFDGGGGGGPRGGGFMGRGSGFMGRGGRGRGGRFQNSRVKIIGTRHKGKYGKIIGFDASDNFRQIAIVRKSDVLMLDTPRGGHGGQRGGRGGLGAERGSTGHGDWDKYFDSVRETKEKQSSELSETPWWKDDAQQTTQNTGGW